MFGFLKKKKENAATSVKNDDELEMPPMPPELKSDIFSELPAFPEKGKEDDSDFSRFAFPEETGHLKDEPAAEKGVPALPEKQKEEKLPMPTLLQPPKEFKANVHEKEARPQKVEKEEMQHHELRPYPQQERSAVKGVRYVKAATFRDMLDNIAAIQSDVRKVQSMIIWKALQTEETATLEKFETAVEDTQRKLLFVDSLLDEQ